MERNEIKDIVFGKIHRFLPEGKWEELKETDSYRGDLSFDSLDTVELLMDLEKELDISIPVEIEWGMENGSVERTIDYLYERLKDR